MQISMLVLGVLGVSAGLLASFFGMGYTDINAQKWPTLAASSAVCAAGLLGVFMATSRPRVAAVLVLVTAAWLFGEAVVFSQHVRYRLSVGSYGNYSDYRDYAAAANQQREVHDRDLYLATLPLGASATLLVIAAGLILIYRTQAKAR